MGLRLLLDPFNTLMLCLSRLSVSLLALSGFEFFYLSLLSSRIFMIVVCLAHDMYVVFVFVFVEMRFALGGHYKEPGCWFCVHGLCRVSLCVWKGVERPPAARRYFFCSS